jgi:hypothetical protein
LDLVRRAFPDADVQIERGRGAARDDWLDAYAALATAAAISRGDHVTFGGERDAHGVPMRIVHPMGAAT